MLARFERRVFDEGCKVWINRYKELYNIPHWHFEDELIACACGTASVVMDGHIFTLESNDCLFCRRESIHYISGGGDGELIVTQFDRHLIGGQWLRNPLFRDQYGVIDRLEQIYHEFKEKKLRYAEKVNAIMTSLLIDIFRGEDLCGEEVQESASNHRFKELLAQIDMHSDELSFNEAADFMNMSEAYFSRFFKRMAGMNFSHYLNVIRVDRAIDLLKNEPGITMVDVMSQCGFNTLRNFNRVFKEITGMAPSQMPDGFVLDVRSLATEETSFDPTLDSSVSLG